MRALTALAFVFVSASSARAEVTTPAQRAKAILDAQVAAVVADDDQAMFATFAADAVVQSIVTGEPLAELGGGSFQNRLLGGSPHSVLRNAKLGAVVAGGTEHVVWFTSEITLSYRNHEPEQRARTARTTVRLTEVATVDAGWKVVAAIIDQPTDSFSSYEVAIPGATAPGPLSVLAVAPTKLAAGFATDKAAILIGTEKHERAIGLSARKLATSWRKLALTPNGAPREVATAHWAYAQLAVDWKGRDSTSRLRALLVAIPGPDGGWRVVAAHFTKG